VRAARMGKRNLQRGVGKVGVVRARWLWCGYAVGRMAGRLQVVLPDNYRLIERPAHSFHANCHHLFIVVPEEEFMQPQYIRHFSQ